MTDPGALRRVRELSGNTQLSLSQKARVAQSMVSVYERVSSPIRPTTAKKIADVLGVSIEDICVLAEDVQDEAEAVS